MSGDLSVFLFGCLVFVSQTLSGDPNRPLSGYWSVLCFVLFAFLLQRLNFLGNERRAMSFNSVTVGAKADGTL